MRECCYSITSMDYLGMAVIHSVWLIAIGCVFVEFALTRVTSARRRCLLATLGVILMPMFLVLAYSGVQRSWLPFMQPVSFEGASATKWIARLFIIGVTIQSARLMVGLACVAELRRMCRSSSSIPVPEYLRDLQTIRIQIVRTNAIAGPVTVGWLRPVILIPERTIFELTPDQIVLVVKHELAHVSSRDYMWNLIQRVVEAIVFYHPVVWLLGRTLRYEREFACDNSVIQSGVSKLEYSKALASLEQLRSQWDPLLQPSNGAPLLPRIHRLLHERPEQSFSAVRTLVGILIATLGVSLTAVSAPAGGSSNCLIASENTVTISGNDWTLGTSCEPSHTPTATTLNVLGCPE